MAEDCRPEQYTHTPVTWTSSLSPFSVGGLACPLIRLFVVSAWLFCCLVPLARTSYSVRGVGCSRPEPWTRLHCSELHWREPVALSAGQSGAPVKQQSLRTWIVSFFLQHPWQRPPAMLQQRSHLNNAALCAQQASTSCRSWWLSHECTGY